MSTLKLHPSNTSMNLETTENGIGYTDEPVGSKGYGFILFPMPHHSAKDIEQAKAFLRGSRDVVTLRLATEDDRDDLYKKEYFRDARIRSLKWYEVEDEKTLIRSARLSGMSPQDFVSTYVLPFTEEVKKRNLARFGEKIYTF